MHPQVLMILLFYKWIRSVDSIYYIESLLVALRTAGFMRPLQARSPPTSRRSILKINANPSRACVSSRNTINWFSHALHTGNMECFRRVSLQGERGVAMVKKGCRNSAKGCRDKDVDSVQHHIIQYSSAANTMKKQLLKTYTLAIIGVTLSIAILQTLLYLLDWLENHDDPIPVLDTNVPCLDEHILVAKTEVNSSQEIEVRLDHEPFEIPTETYEAVKKGFLNNGFEEEYGVLKSECVKTGPPLSFTNPIKHLTKIMAHSKT
uniref:AlNc14C244G9524 protein n=1 Tax=Albugo laibachii Nc14 TaxID=890382 RepID=F0WT39_9STRA|nr:AlNc14C244G9524 [Albugo laibachii Nc14]|eukprot:CCA24526.1 AlNc14C244G9524 [Albugo laibachii Nc14]